MTRLQGISRLVETLLMQENFSAAEKFCYAFRRYNIMYFGEARLATHLFIVHMGGN